MQKSLEGYKPLLKFWWSLDGKNIDDLFLFSLICFNQHFLQLSQIISYKQKHLRID